MEHLLTWINFVEPWHWVVLALSLIAVEIMVIGSAFLIWLGFSSLIVGIVSTLLPLSGESQFVIFSVLSIIFTVFGKRWIPLKNAPSGDEGLNRRAKRLIGETSPLLSDVKGGKSKVRLSDVIWGVRCDTPLKKGDLIIVKAVKGTHLYVEKA